MRPTVFAVGGALTARTGGSTYNRRMVDALRALGQAVEVVELRGQFPEPDSEARAAAARAFASIPAGAVAVVDGLAFSALPEIAEAHAARLRLVALVHLPIAAAHGLSAVDAARYAAGEQRALAAARAIIITGPGARPLVGRYTLPPHRVFLVEPGTDPAPLAHGSSDGTLRLLCAATVHEGKGHDVLLDALAPLQGARWELTCAGSLTKDPRFASAVQNAAERLGLRDRVHFLGEVPPERLDACYAEADLFVLATRQETYGMAVAEALARGVPVVSTDTGAIAGLVGTDAGIVVPPGDGEAFAGALAGVILDPDRRRRFAEGARLRRGTLPVWEDAASRMMGVLNGVAGE